MNASESIRSAAGSLATNRMRSALASLGVMIGVTAVVSLVGLATGMGGYVESRFSSTLDARVFQISRTSSRLESREDATESRNWPEITKSDAGMVSALLGTNGMVSWSASTTGSVSSRGTTVDDVRIEGVSPSWFELSELELSEGRVFTRAEDSSRTRLCVVGADVAGDLAGEGSLLGSIISLSGNRFVVAGVAGEQGSVFGRSLDCFVTVPFSSYEGLFSNFDPEVVISILPKEGMDTDECIEEATAGMRTARGLRSDEDDDFYVISQSGALETMDEMLAVVSSIVVGIAAISLLVGGIGIMNIMLVTVTERTREIGTRRALGARRSDIARQFVTEAVMISFIGGLAGLVAGSATIALARAFTPLPAGMNGLTFLAALSFSTGVGIASGILPALKAAGISPVEALRHE